MGLILCLCTTYSNLLIEKEWRAVLSDELWPQAVSGMMFDTVPAFMEPKARCPMCNVGGESFEGVQEKQIY